VAALLLPSLEKTPLAGREEGISNQYTLEGLFTLSSLSALSTQILLPWSMNMFIISAGGGGKREQDVSTSEMMS
jgi:hypothetical protein